MRASPLKTRGSHVLVWQKNQEKTNPFLDNPALCQMHWVLYTVDSDFGFRTVVSRVGYPAQNRQSKREEKIRSKFNTPSQHRKAVVSSGILPQTKTRSQSPIPGEERDTQVQVLWHTSEYHQDLITQRSHFPIISPSPFLNPSYTLYAFPN